MFVIKAHKFTIQFPDHHMIIKAKLLSEKAPVTCEAFWELIQSPIETYGKHAMYTGKEISVQLPAEKGSKTKLHEVPPENLTCFPAPGELLFTFMPAFAWAGLKTPIYDLGCFYGPDARTFFPMGWLPGNKFAEVERSDLVSLAEIGALTNSDGKQRMIISRD